MQIADRPLPATEQFSLGGVNSVRGYRQDRFLTDNGFLFSGELHIPIWEQKKQALQIIPFLDIGTGWNNSYNSTNSAGTLAAIGLGVQYDFNYLTAKIQWGIPLISVDKNSNLTWQENHFSQVKLPADLSSRNYTKKQCQKYIPKNRIFTRESVNY